MFSNNVFATDNIFVAAHMQVSGAHFQGLLTNRLPFSFVFSNKNGEAEAIFREYEANEPVPVKEYAIALTELRNLIGNERYKATGRRGGVAPLQPQPA